MADKTAGIDLILTAPNVKPIMDDVIKAWEELSKEEAEAKKRAEEYREAVIKNWQEIRQREVAAKKEFIEYIKAHDEHLRRLKGVAQENTKVKQTIDAIRDSQNAQRADQELFNAQHGKGLLASIKGYFQQRAELKLLEKQIHDVNNELRQLDLRQRAISLSMRRGNSVAIKEYAANEKRIKDLANTLGGLRERHDALSASAEISGRKFAGVSRAFGIIKTGALAAVAAVALVGTAIVAVVAAIGKNNDRAKAQFEKAQKEMARARKALTNALAPVAFTIGEIFENLAGRLADFLEKNSDAIFQWAVSVSGYIAGNVKAIGVMIDNTILFFRKFSAELDVLTSSIAASNALLRGDYEEYGIQVGKLASALVKLDEVNLQFRNRKNPFEEWDKTAAEVEERLLKLGKKFFDTANLTDAQKKAIEQLRKEFEQLRAELNKQLNDQAVKDAGPLGALILKADLAAKAVEKTGARLVEIAVKLRKSQEEIKLIQADVARLAEAIRDEAFLEVLRQTEEHIDSINSRVEDLRAKRAGAGAEEQLRFQREIDKTINDFEIRKEELIKAIQEARNVGFDQSYIDRLVADLDKLNQATNDLINESLIDFITERQLQLLSDQKAVLDKQVQQIKDQREKLAEALESGDVSDETKKSLQLQIDVKTEELAVAEEEIRQLEASIDSFNQSGKFLVVQTKVQITEQRKRVEQGIRDIPAGDTDVKFGELDGFQKFAVGTEKVVSDIDEFVKDVVDKYGPAFNYLRDIVVASIDAQIEAVNRLVDARRQSVEDLEQDLELEATFKANGLANDYEILKEKLDSERKLLEADQKKQADLQEKRAKIQKAQDTATQASSLATAVANTFKGFSEIPLVGQILALAAIAAMFTAFAASKIQANKLARAYKGSRRLGQTFGQFAPGEGYDDRPGVDRGLSVLDKNGQLRGYIGGDEFMHKESVSRKHRDFLTYLNEHEDEFKNLNLIRTFEGYRELQKAGKLYYDVPALARTVTKTRERLMYKEAKRTQGITKEEMNEAIQKAMKDHAQTMINYFESRPSYRDASMKEYYEETAKSKKHHKR